MSEQTEPAGMSARSPDGRTRLALVTGASSGIGQAFARRLGGEGYNLVVVGRRRDRLEDLVAALPGVEVRPLVADLGTDAGVEAVAGVCEREALTMLVNNAGVAHYMPFTVRTPDAGQGLADRRLGARPGCGFQCIPPTHTDFKPPIVLI